MTDAPPSVPDLVAQIREALPITAFQAQTALSRLEGIAVRSDASCAVCYEAARAEGRAEASA